MKVKLVAVLLSVLMLASAFVGCAKPDTPPGPPDKDKPTKAPNEQTESYQETITYVPQYEFDTTSTQNTGAATDLAIYRMVYDTLIEVDTSKGGKNLIPGLAESWEQVSPTVLDMNLRKGVKFSNGDDFDAEDVDFTFTRGKEQGGSKSKLKSFDHIEIVDKYKIRIVLNSPNMDFVFLLTDGRLSILSKQAFDTMSVEEAEKIGTGPYMYEEWVRNDHVSLIRNDNCWKGKAKTKRFVIRLINEQSARLIALQNGEVDIIASPAANDLHYIADDPSLRLYPFMSSCLRVLSMNTWAPYTDDVKVRQAIAYGINRDEYNGVAYLGTGLVVNNVMHPDSEYCVEIDATEYNPEKAKQLLADAGYKEGEITLEVLGSDNVVDGNFATLFQSQMQLIGINVNYNPEDTTAFIVDRSGGRKFNIIIETWCGFTVGPDNAMRMVYYSDAPYNKPNIHDEFVDSILDEAIQTLDMAKRIELYGKLEQYINDQAFEVPILVEPCPIAAKASLMGVVPLDGLVIALAGLYIPTSNSN